VDTGGTVQGTPGDRTPAPETRRVLLTGARGFVGSEVLRQLLASGHEVVAISRRLQAKDASPGVIQVAADITGDGWQRWCQGCGAAIHLVGIIRQVPRAGVTFERAHVVATRRVIAACRALGIRRLVHMSALGAREGAATAYHRTKWQGEEAVRASGLDWTIFRPSTLFGPGDGFSTTIARAVRRFPVFPVFGDGTYRVQPIAVDEVARCFVAALERPVTVGETYELGGPEALTYNEVLRRVGQALGLRRAFVHLPLGLSKLAVSVIQHVPGAPITRDQLTMLLEGSTCDSSAASLTFGVPAARFQGPVWMRNGKREE
jgi:NADH dehydrogenase